MDLQNMFETAKPALIAIGFKVVGAIASTSSAAG